ncbi:hypothetical protein B0H13DRAFT_1861856 [Mycena leptocephala]|nr:hypothetical protein B0H13DRAFT_1861856 [Mycena leptocephala]
MDLPLLVMDRMNILTELGIQDMRFVGELRYGKYADDFENVHPDILQCYANEAVVQVTWIWPSRATKTDTFGTKLLKLRNTNFFLAVKKLAEFFMTHSRSCGTGIIPIGMGVAEVEWEDGFYPETEAVKVGRKDIETPLPFRVWWPRAAACAQGLEMMAKIRAVERGDIVLP